MNTKSYIFDSPVLKKISQKGHIITILNHLSDTGKINLMVTHIQYEDLEREKLPFSDMNLKTSFVHTAGFVFGISGFGQAAFGSDEDNTIIEKVEEYTGSTSLGLIASTASSNRAILVTDEESLLNNFEKVGLIEDPSSWSQFARTKLSLLDYDYVFPVEKNKVELTSLFTKVKLNLIPEMKKHPELIKSMNRREFEVLVAELFSDFGYSVELTRRTGDGGADIIAIKNRADSGTYLIQCKRPNIGNKVSIEPIRELYGVVSASGASKGIIATSAFFTKDAKDFLRSQFHTVQGRDYNALVEWLNFYNAK